MNEYKDLSISIIYLTLAFNQLTNLPPVKWNLLYPAGLVGVSIMSFLLSYSLLTEFQFYVIFILSIVLVLAGLLSIFLCNESGFWLSSARDRSEIGIPNIVKKVVKTDASHTIRFVKPINTSVPFLYSAILCVALYQNAIDSHIAPHPYRELYGLLSVVAVVFALLSTIPRNLSLNFDNRIYESTWGFGPFALKHSGKLDEITGVNVAGKAPNRAARKYTLTISFGSQKWSLMRMLTLKPPYNLNLMVWENEHRGLWQYAKQLADRIGVPCAAVGWKGPDATVSIVQTEIKRAEA